MVELLVKCLVQMTKSLSTSLENVHFDEVIFETHQFLQAHPPAYWKQRSVRNIYVYVCMYVCIYLSMSACMLLFAFSYVCVFHQFNSTLYKLMDPRALLLLLLLPLSILSFSYPVISPRIFHSFFVQDDVQLKAIKTVLTQLAKLLGPSVLSHLRLVGGTPSETTVGAYIMLKLTKDGFNPETATISVFSDYIYIYIYI